MKTLLQSFALCALGAVICFLLLTTLGINKETASAISTVILGTLPQVRETLEKWRHQPTAGASTELRSIGEYEVSPGRAVLYATLVSFAALNFASGVAGVIAGINQISLESVGILMVSIIFTIGFPVLVLVGRWIGRRCSRRGLLVVLASAFLTRVIGSVFDRIAMADEDYLRLFGSDKYAPSDILTQLAVGTVLFSAMLGLGFLIGRRQRLAAYLSYLLKQLTQESQLLMVDLAYEEARRIARDRAADKAPTASVRAAGAGLGLPASPRSSSP